jgi:hypothetical protein
MNASSLGLSRRSATGGHISGLRSSSCGRITSTSSICSINVYQQFRSTTGSANCLVTSLVSNSSPASKTWQRMLCHAAKKTAQRCLRSPCPVLTAMISCAVRRPRCLPSSTNEQRLQMVWPGRIGPSTTSYCARAASSCHHHPATTRSSYSTPTSWATRASRRPSCSCVAPSCHRTHDA